MENKEFYKTSVANVEVAIYPEATRADVISGYFRFEERSTPSSP